jgi:hypothetical protein
MNQQIEKLIQQATTEEQDGFLYFDKKKFAELIVRECAKVAWYHTPDTEELEYSHLIEDKILKHFGVEE